MTNIVYFDQGVALGGTWEGDKYVMNWNVYFDASKSAPQFPGGTFQQWQSRGHDTNSVVADPLFVAPRKDDFTLRPGSPALKIGFRPIDLRKVGPR